MTVTISMGIADIKIAIASGKGGTGKTLISTNMFYILQKHARQTTLVDCDAEEPNDLIFFSAEKVNQVDVSQKVPVIDEDKCTFCGLCHDYCSYNAIFVLPTAKIIKVIDDLCHGCGACSVACTDEAIREKDVSLGKVSRFHTSEGADIIEARMKVGVFSPVSVIKAAIREAGNEGIILLDSPPGTSCPFIQTVAKADYVILVTEPTPFGLSDLKQSVDTLKTMNRPFGVIINRGGLGDRNIYDYLQTEQIPLLMEIPYDQNIAELYSKGEIVASFKKEWEPMFIYMLNTITGNYGNSGNQR